MSDVPVETVANDRSLDDPEWIKVIAGEAVEGIEGVDWVGTTPVVSDQDNMKN